MWQRSVSPSPLIEPDVPDFRHPALRLASPRGTRKRSLTASVICAAYSFLRLAIQLSLKARIIYPSQVCQSIRIVSSSQTWLRGPCIFAVVPRISSPVVEDSIFHNLSALETKWCRKIRSSLATQSRTVLSGSEKAPLRRQAAKARALAAASPYRSLFDARRRSRQNISRANNAHSRSVDDSHAARPAAGSSFSASPKRFGMTVQPARQHPGAAPSSSPVQLPTCSEHSSLPRAQDDEGETYRIREGSIISRRTSGLRSRRPRPRQPSAAEHTFAPWSTGCSCC